MERNSAPLRTQNPFRGLPGCEFKSRPSYFTQDIGDSPAKSRYIAVALLVARKSRFPSLGRLLRTFEDSPQSNGMASGSQLRPLTECSMNSTSAGPERSNSERNARLLTGITFKGQPRARPISSDGISGRGWEMRSLLTEG